MSVFAAVEGLFVRGGNRPRNVQLANPNIRQSLMHRFLTQENRMLLNLLDRRREVETWGRGSTVSRGAAVLVGELREVDCSSLDTSNAGFL